MTVFRPLTVFRQLTVFFRQLTIFDVSVILLQGLAPPSS
jgi:hypothetical protein